MLFLPAKKLVAILSYRLLHNTTFQVSIFNFQIDLLDKYIYKGLSRQSKNGKSKIKLFGLLLFM